MDGLSAKGALESRCVFCCLAPLLQHNHPSWALGFQPAGLCQNVLELKVWMPCKENVSQFLAAPQGYHLLIKQFSMMLRSVVCGRSLSCKETVPHHSCVQRKELKCICGPSHWEAVDQPGFSPHPHCALRRDLLLPPSHTHLSGLELSHMANRSSSQPSERGASLMWDSLLSVQALRVMLRNSYSCKEIQSVRETSHFYRTSCFGA